MKTDVKYKNFELIPNESEITFNPRNRKSYEKYVNILNKWISDYKDYTPRDNRIHCDNERNPKNDEVCITSKTWFDDCKANDWGFSLSKPCLLMTYRNDPSFNPQPFTNQNELLTIAQIPESFKTIIREEISDRENGFDEKLIRVFCNDTNYESYYPYQGFKTYYFPNKNHLANYQPPLVGIAFDMTKRKELNVQCGIWAKSPSNINKVSFKINTNL